MGFCGVILLVYSLTVYSDEECGPGKYGDDCDLDCPHNCHVLPNTPLLCNKNKGHCTEGCKRNFYGDLCSETCSRNCKGHICNQHNGHCSWGCIENHIGDFCEIAQDPTPGPAGTTFGSHTTVTTRVRTTNRSSVGNDGIIQIIIPIVVTVLVLVGFVCTVIFFKRCSESGPQDPELGQELLPASNPNDRSREDTSLHKACRNGTLANVRQILSEGLVDKNSIGECGLTPVMMAAKSGRRKLVDLLVRKQCDLSLTDDDGNTILHVASIAGHVKIVRYVLSKKVVDVNSSGHCNRTPVMAAARFGQKKVFDLLVQNGSDLSKVDSDGNNILHIACIGGNVDIVSYVLNKAKFDINSRGNIGMTPVMFAVTVGRLEVFELLVGMECFLSTVDKTGMNILHMACGEGNVDMVKHILQKDVISVDCKDNSGKTPVMLAAEFGHTDVFKLLVDKQCDTLQVCENGNNVLHISCALGHVDIVKCITFDGSVNVDSCGQYKMTPVLFAAKFGQRDIFHLLVDKGCDMSVLDKDGNTVLHMACIGGKEDIVKVVLSQEGVDINKRGQFGRTPIMVAAACGHQKVFDVLVNRGADLTLVDADDFGICELISMGGHLQMMGHVQNIINCR